MKPWICLLALGSFACGGATEQPDTPSLSPPVLVAEPALLDFGWVDGRTTRTLTLRNDGEAELGIRRMEIDDASFEIVDVSCTPWRDTPGPHACRLAAGESATVEVRLRGEGDALSKRALWGASLIITTDIPHAFDPSAEGPYPDPTLRPATVGLRAAACDQVWLATPTSIDLGNGGRDSTLSGSIDLWNRSETTAARLVEVAASSGVGCDALVLTPPSDDQVGRLAAASIDLELASAGEPVDCAVSVTYASECPGIDDRTQSIQVIANSVVFPDQPNPDVDADGDGQTPNEGDCNDRDPSMYTGAAEIRDRVDNDCDGRIDDGTMFYDDDGDGTNELQRDCDDSNVAVGPDAVEICGNGIDDDCDSIPDANDPQGCVVIDTDAVFFGGIRGPTHVEAGSEVSFVIEAGDPSRPGHTVGLTWSTSAGSEIDVSEANVLRWRAPDESALVDGEARVTVTAQVNEAGLPATSVSTEVRVVEPGTLTAGIPLR